MANISKIKLQDTTYVIKDLDAYVKPSTGIPASDLASGVIPDVSNFITNSVNDLANYYLKSDTYTKTEVAELIGAINQFHYEIAASTSAVDTPASNVLYLIGPTGSGSDQYEEYVYTSNWVKIGDTSIDLSGYVTITALNTTLADYTTTANLTTLLAGKQDTINDLSDIRSGAAAGATAYQKPATGIPASDIATGVIPDISGKQDTLVSGTNIKTINNESILGSGNITIEGGTADIEAAAGSHINEVGTPTITASTSGDTTTFTFDYLKGAAGQNGTNGTNGTSCTHSWNGTTLTVTSASGTSSADLKGAKGDTGATGPTGPQGPAGADGLTTKISVNGNTYTQSSGTITLPNYPSVPTKVSQLTNDSGYTTNTGTITGITMNGSSKGTSGVVNLGTVLTSHQDISGKADKANITSGTAGTSSATSGSTLAVPYVTMNAQGIVTGYGTHTHTITGFLTSHQSLAGYEPRYPVNNQSSSSFTAAVENYYRFASAVGTMTITLPAPSDSYTHSIFFKFTTGSSPAVTFSSSKSIIYYSDFAIEASKTYEVNALYNGTEWIVAFATIG